MRRVPTSIAFCGVVAVALTLANTDALLTAQQSAGAPGGPASSVTFTRDIAPILQRGCQTCHRPNALAPMSPLTYEDARPYAASMKKRTGLRNRQGVMPPWYIEKDLGIQHCKADVSLERRRDREDRRVG
jgi:mono/diheme cytochrome c family protein